jgi:hypothetical protein
MLGVYKTSLSLSIYLWQTSPIYSDIDLTSELSSKSNPEKHRIVHSIILSSEIELESEDVDPEENLRCER